MASAVYSEPLASRLSISLEGEASSSPFPSPSSSFLPPPTPGAHEFAMKPAPTARNSRKTSIVHPASPPTNGDSIPHEESVDKVASTSAQQANGLVAKTPPVSPSGKEGAGVNGEGGGKTMDQHLPNSHSSAINGDDTVLAESGKDTVSAPQEQPNVRITTSGTTVLHPEPPAIEHHAEEVLSEKSPSDTHPHYLNGNGSVQASSVLAKDSLSPAPSSPMLTSPTTPTPYSFQHQPRLVPSDHLEPPISPAVEQSTSSSTTPTILTTALPPDDTDGPPMTPDTRTSSNSSTSTTTGKKESPPPAKIIIPDNLLDVLASQSATAPPSGPSSPAFSTFSTSSRRSRPMSTSFAADPSLFSSRPAPPSPAMSRRVSGAPSLAASSRPPSTSVSRANSKRISSASSSAAAAAARSQAGSPVINPLRLSVSSQKSQGGFPSPLPSPQNLTFGALAMASVSTSPPTGSGVSPAIHVSSPQQQRRATPSSAAATPASIPATPSTAVPGAASTLPTVYIKVRDFGFPYSDPRHAGLGTDVPKPNDVARLNRRLRRRRVVSGCSAGSVESSDGDGAERDEEDEDEDEDDEFEAILRGGGGGGGGTTGYSGRGFDSFRMGMGRMSWSARGSSNTGGFWPHQQATAATVLAAASAFPSSDDFNRNFLDGDSEEERESEEEPEYAVDDDEEDMQGGAADDEEDTLFPGLYRAVYAFEPEGTAEMRLEEDQIVRVVGRGGGVGWAVVIDENATAVAAMDGEDPSPRHALVPESYLEPVRFDYEDDGLEGGVAP